MSQIQNTTKRPISSSSKKIGVVFGGFSPLHSGHKQQIYKAAMLNDEVIVVVSGYKGEKRGDGIGLPLEKRFRYLRETFNDEPTIHIGMLDETDIPRYPNGWSGWVNKLESVMSTLIQDDMTNHEINVYVGEAVYKTKLSIYEPSWNVSVADRSTINISATEIRENPTKYWDYIDRVFRRAFTKKVLITGAASGGKSTLVRRLARSMGAPFSEEYARTYEEDSNVDDNELTVNDYFQFIAGQYNANSAEIKSASNNGIVVFDTDAITTRTYANLYLPKEDANKLEPFFQDTISKQEFDLILVVPPVAKYVDDGFRAMEWEDSRDEFHDNLMAQFEEFGLMDKVVLLDSPSTEDDPQGFYVRYVQATQAITKYTGVKFETLS
ncbi:nicotinamide-nucleotide adenylyltransferase [Streptomyces sp. TRM76323]|uniref:Nicotinamide-nucleotide adenylyltransferase n=1 Tax=Streptomyces tamarix TaxID=3078565 RepID=A0ABU3QKN3_9ACTN|nr:nicotinamide-nucleotide adenylyltransferase [Streptomyces tamarix]MDT9683333.1 nicotinamide-nucleotide adenylyltransferase [Streptomyces tamarix]